MSEYVSIQSDQDIDQFLLSTNALHDGYIISVRYFNNGIRAINGGYQFDSVLTELSIRILVTSIHDAVVELVFDNIVDWQIKDDQSDITDTAISLTNNGCIIWTDYGSYVVARNMKWKIDIR